MAINSSEQKNEGRQIDVEKPKRPKSVSVISWILIVRNFIPYPSLPVFLYGYIREPDLLDHSYMVLGPIPVAPPRVVAFSSLVVPILIYIAVVVALFRGYNWGRFLYLICKYHLDRFWNIVFTRLYDGSLFFSPLLTLLANYFRSWEHSSGVGFALRFFLCDGILMTIASTLTYSY
jgi:hypothetical protein